MQLNPIIVAVNSTAAQKSPDNSEYSKVDAVALDATFAVTSTIASSTAEHKAGDDCTWREYPCESADTYGHQIGNGFNIIDADGSLKDSKENHCHGCTNSSSRNSNNEWPPIYVRMLAMIASLNSCNLGYDQGVNAGVVESLQTDGHGFKLSDFQIEMFVGVLSFAALLGSMSMSFISDRFGRRATFFFSSIVFLIGVSTMTAAPSFTVLLIGRVITGFGIGLGLAIDPMYIAEVSPAAFRGQLVSWSETATNVGVLFGFVASYCFRNTTGSAQWRGMIALGVILPSLLLVLVLCVMPESPRWLIHRGRKEEAAIVLKNCAGASEIAHGMVLADQLQMELEREAAESAGITWRSVFSGVESRRKLLAGVGMAVMQQITAEEAILYYMISILADAGISSVDEQFGALVMVGIAKVLSIIVAGYLFDNFGRKPLLMASNAGIAFALFLLAGVSNHVPAAGFAALIIYVVAFSGGMGPGAWLLPSEVFSNDIRAKGMSLCTFSNRAAALIVTTTFLSMRTAMGVAGCFSVFAFIALGNILYIWRFVPETKGKTLEEVHDLFTDEHNRIGNSSRNSDQSFTETYLSDAVI